MKIVIADNYSGNSQTQQNQSEVVIIHNQPNQNSQKESKMSVDAEDEEEQEPQSQENDEILFVLKEENTNENNGVITIENCVNQDGQLIWLPNEGNSEGQSGGGGQQTLYTIKQLNYSQVCG